MAGIGFELRKAISRGGIGSFLKAAFSGMMIVAGPWIMSIIGITAIQRLMSFAVDEAPEHFMGVVIYSYAWSLFLFGGVQFIYTRIMADLLFVKKERQAAGALVFFLIPTAVVTGAIAAVAVAGFEVPVTSPLLFKISAVVLFVSINVVWLLMIFISLLKWYGRILFIYTAGMVISLLLVFLLGSAYGAAGALAGYAGGQLGTATLLALLSFIAYRPTAVWKNARTFVDYAGRFWKLLATGIIYYWGIWIDKMVFWFVLGDRVEGTFILLFGNYDISVYLANLSMIPGLIFFIISSETGFYVELRRFLVSLSKSTFAEIQRRKITLLASARSGLFDQSIFQGVMSLTLVLVAPFIATFFGLETGTLRIVIVAVYLHLLYLTLMNFHFYLEFYRHALIGAVIFFVVNGAGALTALPGIPTLAPGLSYLTGCAAAALYSAITLFRSARRIDRIILAGA